MLWRPLGSYLLRGRLRDKEDTFQEPAPRVRLARDAKRAGRLYTVAARWVEQSPVLSKAWRNVSMASMNRGTLYAALIWLVCVAGGLGLGAASVSAHPNDDGGVWRDLPPIPDPPGAQQEHAVVVLRNKIYVLGGV